MVDEPKEPKGFASEESRGRAELSILAAEGGAGTPVMHRWAIGYYGDFAAQENCARWPCLARPRATGVNRFSGSIAVPGAFFDASERVLPEVLMRIACSREGTPRRPGRRPVGRRPFPLRPARAPNVTRLPGAGGRAGSGSSCVPWAISCPRMVHLLQPGFLSRRICSIFAMVAGLKFCWTRRPTSHRDRVMPARAPRQAPIRAGWSAPARLRTPPPRATTRRRVNPARSDRALLIIVTNFGLFFLYVCTLFVLASDSQSELRLALPLGLAVFALAGFAPLALSFSRRNKRREPPRRKDPVP